MVVKEQKEVAHEVVPEVALEVVVDC